MTDTRKLVVGFTKLAQAVRSQFWRRPASHGVSPTQGGILALLARPETSGLHLSDLAADLGIRPATASDSISALLKKGLVTRERRKEDQRALKFRLTRKGREEVRRRTEAAAPFEQALKALPEAERTSFYRTHVKIIRHLQEKEVLPLQRMCLNCQNFRPFAHANSAKPHHCDFGDFRFGDRDLRLDCLTHRTADRGRRNFVWKKFQRIQSPGATGGGR